MKTPVSARAAGGCFRLANKIDVWLLDINLCFDWFADFNKMRVLVNNGLALVLRRTRIYAIAVGFKLRQNGDVFFAFARGEVCDRINVAFGNEQQVLASV